jgi:hypothetical protein
MGCTKKRFLIVGGNQRNNEKHKGTSQNQFFLDYLSFPLVSFDFLWFGAGGFYGFSLFSFGFQGGNKGIPNPRQNHKPIKESLSRL